MAAPGRVYFRRSKTRPLAGSAQTKPRSVGGTASDTRARTQPRDDPRNVLAKTSG